ncbi:hypothetical protein [Fodinicurvata halophila]|uniref:hypothetical protein n=1 Tax=Fodinicurvata halophila TaxID=1419723 RepID=UPI003644B995
MDELVEQRIQRLFLPRPCVTEELRPTGRNLEIRTNPCPTAAWWPPMWTSPTARRPRNVCVKASIATA